MRTLLILLFIVVQFSLLEAQQRPFIATFSDRSEIRLVPKGEPYEKYDVDWNNDGVYDDVDITGEITHTYVNGGEKTIAIRGTLAAPPILCPGRLIRIEQWGDIQWRDLEAAFKNCFDLEYLGSDSPDLSNVTNLNYLFQSCYSANSNIDGWDVSNVTEMRQTFHDAWVFNSPLNSWDVSNVTTMSEMFEGARNFNQPLGNWDVSNVKSMSAMFEAASRFNQDIDNWDVSNVTGMNFMFNGADDFNQPLNSWDVSKVEVMRGMFSNMDSFNQPLNNWNVSNVEITQLMFRNAKSFDQSLGSWDVSNVSVASDMLSFSNLSVANYDATLQGWSTLQLTPDVRLGAHELRYCKSENARTILESRGWSLEGDELSPNCGSSLGDCPDFTNLTVELLQVGVTPKTCDQRGDIHPPSGGCPSGSEIRYSIDGGSNWTDRLPDYNQDESITIESRCECSDDASIVSASSYVTTSPEGCGSACPGFDITSDELNVGITEKTCQQRGDIHPPSGRCPSGSTMMFSLDEGVNWTERLPDYNQDESITIRTSCRCNDNMEVGSVSGYVITSPEDCGGGSSCPDFENININNITVGITPKTCDQRGDIHPPSGGCPSGSEIRYSIDGGANWTDRLPDYNQEESITIESRCECREDPDHISASGNVTTNPQGCGSSCPSFDITSASLEVGVTEKTCNQRGDIHPPSGNCPSGSTMMFSTDGGQNWAERLPDYNQDESITIRTSCLCNDDQEINSVSAYVTTHPEGCDDCPDLSVLSERDLQVVVTLQTCDASGSISEPIAQCPNGSTMEYSTDFGNNWSTQLPEYETNPEANIASRCRCDEDSGETSRVGIYEGLFPPNCPGCPDLDGIIPTVGVVDKTCSEIGDILYPSTKCPQGSRLLFSIDDGQNWTDSAPDYDQNESITVRSRCQCLQDPDVVGDSGYATTNPDDCGSSNSCPSFDVTSHMLEVGITEKTCNQRGDIHPPTGTCPTGSTMHFSTNGGGTWTTSLPDFDQNKSITIRTSCLCDDNPEVNSLSGYVTTSIPSCDELSSPSASRLRSNNFSNELQVFPNPAYDAITINLSVHNEAKVKIRILDMVGKTVRSYNSSEVQLKAGRVEKMVSLDDLSGGLYLVHVWTDDVLQSKKILVIK